MRYNTRCFRTLFAIILLCALSIWFILYVLWLPDLQLAVPKVLSTQFKVLIFVEQLPPTNFVKQIVTILGALRVPHELEQPIAERTVVCLIDFSNAFDRAWKKKFGRKLKKMQLKGVKKHNFDLLADDHSGKYSIFIFENLYRYVNMRHFRRVQLDSYCRRFNVTNIGFLPSVKLNEPQNVKRSAYENVDFDLLNLRVSDGIPTIDKLTLNPEAPVWRILKREGLSSPGHTPQPAYWSVFHGSDPSVDTYEPILVAERSGLNGVLHQDYAVVRDKGVEDGIQRFLFGQQFSHWLIAPVFLECLLFSLEPFGLSFPLTRYLQIDVDDVFVGRAGNRITPVDIEAMLDFQKRMANFSSGFRLNLGFSGSTFHRGSDLESMADDLLIEKANKFRWFPHLFAHNKAWLLNQSTLVELMGQNLKFAKSHQLSLNPGYVIAPHHGGVYPVHIPLYQAWKRVWNASVTVTEEYPHLHTFTRRRGFQFMNIKVLPRQTCGLFTHNKYLKKYPRGPQALDASIEGGELFMTIILTRVLIFMTHVPNFAYDRLAIYTFDKEVNFLNKWTNLKFSSPTSMAQMSKIYFNLYPGELDPVWGNPCDDSRHLEVWAPHKTCSSLPKFIIVGPQKSGSTALFSFLKQHPQIKSSFAHKKHFEELQFFSENSSYFQGIDHYMKYFPTVQNSSTKIILFEKSATYFDRSYVPNRASLLLKDAKILIILRNPVDRAYSWYQHQRAHDLPEAVDIIFDDLIRLERPRNEFEKKVLSLRSRCLNPGKYIVHIMRWVKYYPLKQIAILDGEQLRSNPIGMLNNLQTFLEVDIEIDFANLIKFSEEKQFYCPFNRTGFNCLGIGKGRQYPPMSEDSREYLNQFYWKYNSELLNFLKSRRLPLMSWLEY